MPNGGGGRHEEPTETELRIAFLRTLGRTKHTDLTRELDRRLEHNRNGNIILQKQIDLVLVGVRKLTDHLNLKRFGEANWHDAINKIQASLIRDLEKLGRQRKDLDEQQTFLGD